MRTAFKALLIGIFFGVASGCCAAVDFVARFRKSRHPGDPGELVPFVLEVEPMLWAIRQVESGDTPLAHGPHGERSAYQFKPGTWAMHTTVPFLQAGFHPEIDDLVAHKHLALLRRGLAERGIDPSPEWIAATWHHWIDCSVVDARSDAAVRVANLYYDRVGRIPR